MAISCSRSIASFISLPSLLEIIVQFVLQLFSVSALLLLDLLGRQLCRLVTRFGPFWRRFHLLRHLDGFFACLAGLVPLNLAGWVAGAQQRWAWQIRRAWRWRRARRAGRVIIWAVAAAAWRAIIVTLSFLFDFDLANLCRRQCRPHSGLFLLDGRFLATHVDVSWWGNSLSAYLEELNLKIAGK